MQFLEIGESSARELLRACGSPAADTQQYRARRLTNGWCFMWMGTESFPPADGGLSWVVTDTGLVSRVLNNETEESVLAYLLRS